MYISAKTIKERFDVSAATLRRWADDGKVQVIRGTGIGKRLYKEGDIENMFGAGAQIALPKTQKKAICYARVSSSHQKQDLARQIADLTTAFPNHKLISDVGSGLNFERKGFKAILEQVHSGLVSEVVVTHKDRLCRYGIEMVDFIFRKTETKLVVLNKSLPVQGHDTTQELAEDLLAVVTVFVARHNGQRSGENKRRRKLLAEEAKNQASKETSARGEANSDLSSEGPAQDSGDMDQCREVDIQQDGRSHKKQKMSTLQADSEKELCE